VFQDIRVNTVNCWENAETWEADHHTYPSKNGEDEETLGKRTDVRGIVPTENRAWEPETRAWWTPNRH